MSRPVKWRRINQIPSFSHFIPAGGESAAENVLLFEELEAIRLKDLEGLEQEACAEQMQISRPTFQRILIAARQKVADSLINGKAIRIAGGNFTRNVCAVHCLECGQIWTDRVESLTGGSVRYTCPNCKSDRVVCESPESCMNTRGGRSRHCKRGCRRPLTDQIIK